LDTHDAIGKVRAEKKVGVLRDLIPAMGRMYGWLSKSTHAGIDEHQESFQVDDDERGIVILAQSRLAESAANLLLLSDAWVVVWEVTQRQHLSEFTSIESADDPTPRSGREFLLQARDRVASIDEAERDARLRGATAK
jgi:hypothetical protein